MGLAAFNRARQRREREAKNALRVQNEQFEQERQANEQAANAVINLVSSLDRESPEFVKTVLGARVAFNTLTPEQRELVTNVSDLEQFEQEALNFEPKGGDDNDEPENPDNANGVEETGTGIDENPQSDIAAPNGAHKPKRTRQQAE